MPKPRVFISSTCDDLVEVRNQLEQFVTEMGYEPLLWERGHIAPQTQKPLAESCYEEIEQCDMLVSIISTRFGSLSDDGVHSISQREVLKAQDLAKPVFMFVLAQVHDAYHRYQQKQNAANYDDGIENAMGVYSFLDAMYSRQSNNYICPFRTANDITQQLKELWARLFQVLLRNPVINSATEPRRVPRDQGVVLPPAISEQDVREVLAEVQWALQQDWDRPEDIRRAHLNLLNNRVFFREQLEELVRSEFVVQALCLLYVSELPRPAVRPLDAVAVATWGVALFYGGVDDASMERVRLGIRQSPEYRQHHGLTAKTSDLVEGSASIRPSD